MDGDPSPELGAHEAGNLGALYAALAAAQGELQPAKKDATNTHFRRKYSSLSSVQEAIRQPFSKHGLAIVQGVEQVGKVTCLVTEVGHAESGQCRRFALPLGIATDAPAQQLGTWLTYARRYMLSSIAGVSCEEDDDGEADRRARSERERSGGSTRASSPRPSRSSGRDGKRAESSPRVNPALRKELLEAGESVFGTAAEGEEFVLWMAWKKFRASSGQDLERVTIGDLAEAEARSVLESIGDREKLKAAIDLFQKSRQPAEASSE